MFAPAQTASPAPARWHWRRGRAISRRTSFSPRTVIPMSELPDRLCNDPASPYYNAVLLERGVGIRFNGKEKTNVEEYCVSEGWIRVTAGTAKDRYGNPLTIKLKGEVVPYLRDP
jgi:hypothetical protein